MTATTEMGRGYSEDVLVKVNRFRQQVLSPLEQAGYSQLGLEEMVRLYSATGSTLALLV